MVEVGRVTAVIDGELGPLKAKMAEARSMSTSAASGIEHDFKKGFGSGLQSSVSGLTASMGPLGSAISGVSGGLGLVATGALASVVAVGALGAAAVSTAADWQSLMAGVSKTTGVEGSGLNQLSADLQRIRTETGATAADIANATITTGSVGIPKEELAGFTEVALQMGSAFSMSSESAVSGISAIGNSAKESGTSWTEFATRAGSSVNVLADSMRTSEEQILTGMTHLGATMGLLKPPEDTVPAWMAVVATVQSLGLAGDQAGEAIQDALTYAAKDAKGAISGLLGVSSTQLQLDLRSNAPEVLQDVAKAIAALPLDQQAQAMAAFGSTGSKAIALLMGDLDETTGEFDKLGTAIDDSNQAWKEGTSLSSAYTASQNTFNTAVDRLGASLDVAGQKLGTVFLPALTDAVNWLTEGVTAATEFGSAIYGAFDTLSSNGLDMTINGEDWTLDWSGLHQTVADEVGDASEEGVAEGTEKGMAEGSEKAKDDIKKSTKESVAAGAEEGFDEAAKAYWSNVENLQRQGIQTGYAASAYAGMVSKSSNASWKRGKWGTAEKIAELDVGIRHDVSSQGSKYTLRIDGKDTGISRSIDNFDTTPREDLVQSMLDEYGLRGADEATVLKLANKPGEAAKLELRKELDVVADVYFDFSENLKGEIEDAGIEIGEAFASGMVPDADQIDSRLDAIRRLKLYDPDEYERQGAEGAEEYLVSLQSALDAYEAAKIAYIAEPSENTLSDFKKTLGQVQDLANNMPLILKAEIDMGQVETNLAIWISEHASLFEAMGEAAKQKGAIGAAPTRGTAEGLHDIEMRYADMGENGERQIELLNIVEGAISSGDDQQLGAAYAAYSELLSMDSSLATNAAFQALSAGLIGITNSKMEVSNGILREIKTDTGKFLDARPIINNYNTVNNVASGVSGSSSWDYMNASVGTSKKYGTTPNALKNALLKAGAAYWEGGVAGSEGAAWLHPGEVVVSPDNMPCAVSSKYYELEDPTKFTQAGRGTVSSSVSGNTYDTSSFSNTIKTADRSLGELNGCVSSAFHIWQQGHANELFHQDAIYSNGQQLIALTDAQVTAEGGTNSLCGAMSDADLAAGNLASSFGTAAAGIMGLNSILVPGSKSSASWMATEFDKVEWGLGQCVNYMSDFAIMQEGVYAGQLFNPAYIGPTSGWYGAGEGGAAESNISAIIPSNALEMLEAQARWGSEQTNQTQVSNYSLTDIQGTLTKSQTTAEESQKSLDRIALNSLQQTYLVADSNSILTALSKNSGSYSTGSGGDLWGGTSINGGGGWIHADPTSDNPTYINDWMNDYLGYKYFAAGGISSVPAIFGEGGEEAAVPIADRAAGLRMFPIVAAKLGIPMFAKGGVVRGSLGSIGAGGGINITIHSPVTFQGNGNAADLDAILERRNKQLVDELTETIAEAKRGF